MEKVKLVTKYSCINLQESIKETTTMNKTTEKQSNKTKQKDNKNSRENVQITRIREIWAGRIQGRHRKKIKS